VAGEPPLGRPAPRRQDTTAPIPAQVPIPPRCLTLHHCAWELRGFWREGRRGKSAGQSQLVHLLEKGRMGHTGAQLRVLQARLDPLDDRSRSVIRLPGLLGSPGCDIELTQCHMRCHICVGLAIVRASDRACRSHCPAASHWRRARAILPWSLQPLTRYFREVVRVAMSTHWAVNSSALAGSPRASQSSPRLAKRWLE
jgi:hypothetical protein